MGPGLSIVPLRCVAIAGFMVAALTLAGGGSSAGARTRWLSPVQLSSRHASSSRPRIAMNPAGDAIVVFEHFRGGNPTGPAGTVQAATRRAGGGFSAPLDISAPSDDNAFFPDVAIDQAGEAIAVT